VETEVSGNGDGHGGSTGAAGRTGHTKTMACPTGIRKQGWRRR
jgi:hypothetical protein